EIADPQERGKYLKNLHTDGGRFEFQLDKRGWEDVFLCRQAFSISLVHPMPENASWHPISNTTNGKIAEPIYNTTNAEIVEHLDYFSTPFSVQQKGQPYLIVRQKK